MTNETAHLLHAADRPLGPIKMHVLPSLSSRNALAAVIRKIEEGAALEGKAERMHGDQIYSCALRGNQRAPKYCSIAIVDTMHPPAAPLEVLPAKALLSIGPTNHMA